MNKGQMRHEFRIAVGELDEDDSFYTNDQIDNWLNEAAKVMASIAQPIETLFQVTTSLRRGSTTEYAVEYELPPDMDELFGVTLFNGADEHELTQINEGIARRNNQSVGIPDRFYLRGLTRKRADNGATGITVADLDGKRTRMMLGLYPRPAGAYPITVCYYSHHFDMKNDFDVPIIPVQFRRGLIAYALWLAKKADDAYAEANIYKAEFAEFADKCREKMINRGQETNFPVVRIRDEEDCESEYSVGYAY